MQLSSVSFAQYEVVSAKTIKNAEDVSSSTRDNVKNTPTYNDPDIPNFSEEDSVATKIEEKTRKFFEKRKNKKSKTLLEDENILEEDTKAGVQKTTVKSPIRAGEEVVDDKNRFQINADKITYDDEDGNIYAKGNVEIIAKAQGVTLRADDAVLDKPTQTLKLHNNVKIIKDGVEMFGEYMLVDLNEENVLMDNPTADAYQFVIKAQEGYLIANDIQMINGTLQSSRPGEFVFETRGFQAYENVAMDYIYNRNIDRSGVASSRKQVYDINAKEIVLTRYKDHNSILLKDSDIYYNKRKITNKSDIEIISDKQNTATEINAPEAGTLRNFGTYVGYGFVHRLPKGQLLKLMPVLMYGDSNIGVGLIARHRSKNSLLEAGYGSASTNLVVKGRYKFGNGFGFRYGRNTYIPEGFMGSRRSGYAAQLEYVKGIQVEDLGINFYNAVYAGIFSDFQKHDQEKAYATTRFRYMAEIRKTIFQYENKEQDLKFSLSALAQGQASLYGSGQTTGLVRIGPFFTTKVRRWESSIGYLISGEHGDSPFVFDKYRYGKSSVMLNEKFNFSDKFALGYRATVTLLKDNYEGDLLTESRFYAVFGPQDLKLCVSYDFVRDIANLEFLFLIGSDSSKINFDRLITKNADGSENKRDFYKSKPVKIEVPENI